MITGVVNQRLQLTIAILVEDAAGRSHQVDSILDTGYDGFLTLPPVLIAAFGLPLIGWTNAQIADGSVQQVPVHRTTLTWDGQQRAVSMDVVDYRPLIGTALLADYELRTRFVAGEFVTLEAIP